MLGTFSDLPISQEYSLTNHFEIFCLNIFFLRDKTKTFKFVFLGSFPIRDLITYRGSLPEIGWTTKYFILVDFFDGFAANALTFL